LYHYSQPRRFSDSEIVQIGAFPKDYNFLGQPAGYVVGMSVPPIMVASIAYQIKQQWLDKINK
jgi:DNA (cytosine-5)-methyltransferase 1